MMGWSQMVSCVPELALSWPVGQEVSEDVGGSTALEKALQQEGAWCVWETERGAACLQHKAGVGREGWVCGTRYKQPVHGQGEVGIWLFRQGTVPEYFKQSDKMKGFSSLRDHSECRVKKSTTGVEEELMILLTHFGGLQHTQHCLKHFTGINSPML